MEFTRQGHYISETRICILLDALEFTSLVLAKAVEKTSCNLLMQDGLHGPAPWASFPAMLDVGVPAGVALSCRCQSGTARWRGAGQDCTADRAVWRHPSGGGVVMTDPVR